MRAALVFLSVVVLGGVGGPTAPAVAHGPCDCLNPVLTSPGGKVGIIAFGGQAGGRGFPAYRVIFNPRPDDLGTAPDYLTSAYMADGPTRTVLSRPRRQPTRKARFRVPSDAPPGLYMVLIFDGEEGGAHNSWGYLHVVDHGKPGQTGSPTTGQPGVVTARDANIEAEPGGPRSPDSAPSGTATAPASREGAGLEWLPWAGGLLAVMILSVWGVAQVKCRNRWPQNP